MAVSLETQQRVAELRVKAREGNLTVEEMREAITMLRAERLAMPATASKSRAKAPPVDADALLGELGI